MGRTAEIELARQIATALGIKVEFVDTAQSFNGVVDLIDAGKADIGISKLSQTHARLRRVRFSQPYVTLRHAFLFDRAAISARSSGRPPEDVLRPFDGRIGVIRGSSYVDFAKANFPRAQVVEMKDWDTAIATLLDHGVDAIYRDEFEIRRILKGRPSLNVNFGAAIMLDQKDVLSVAICDSCVKLQEFINFHLSRPQAMFAIRTLLASDLQN
jgi:polar amino acid transport system substrate-binding protein